MKNLFLKVRNDYMQELQDCKLQGNDYHLESDTWSHTMMVFSHSLNDNVKIELQVAALLHDIGKPLSKSIEDNRTFYRGHEGISTYLALKYKKDIHNLALT